jgi:tRNA (guanine37-N1)-methyltransferase
MGESIYSWLLEYPQYTKPREFRGLMVPEVLFSGNHGAIELWNYEQSLALTKERRPDLFESYAKRALAEGTLSKAHKKVLERYTNGEKNDKIKSGNEKED